MTNCNPENERLKRRYFHHLREAEGLAERTIDHAARAIAGFEEFTGWQPFKRFRSDDAVAYKKVLLTGPGKRSIETRARSTVHSRLVHLERFFTWAAEQPGCRSAFRISDAKYFKLARRDRNLAAGRQHRPSPSVEQVRRVILQMPASSDVELRNRAMIAFLLLTGARVSAVRTFRLRHVMRNRSGVIQDANDVATKGSKTFSTYFFPVGDDIREIFLAYLDHLRERLGWGEDEPLFAATKQDVGESRQLEVVGLDRERHWKTADPVRDIFHTAFDTAGLPRYAPHSIRRTLVLLGQDVCRTPMEYKAWSQNLAHNSVLTTFTSYGAVSELRQAEIMIDLTAPQPAPDPDIEHRIKRLEQQMRSRFSKDGGDE